MTAPPPPAPAPDAKKDEAAATAAASGKADGKISDGTTNKKAAAKNKSSIAGGADLGPPQYPDMALCQRMHRLVTSTSDPTTPATELEVQVFDQIIAMKNPSLYATLQGKLAESFGNAPGATAAPSSSSSSSSSSNTKMLVSSAKLTPDDLKSIAAQNDADMKELEEKLATAQESAGDMEVLDAKLEMARFAAAKLDKDAALQRYQDVIDTPKLGGGKKIDAVMEMARICSFYGDAAGCDAHLATALKLANDSSGGGDWDRRNRLKVYQALQFLLHRDFAQAAKLFLEGVATFSSAEICTYPEFLTYAVLTNLLHLPRPNLQAKILTTPELLGTNDANVELALKLARALYDCDYRLYLQTLLRVEGLLLKDRFLFPHASYWMRELHILGYRQFLDAYSSVTLDAMAAAFGVSPAFIDAYASRYIAENRLSAKIDKYGGVIVTNRPDQKNAQYRDMIQKGDMLLNRIQKLARVVDL
jgi:26S proteasome regulatory subunit N7